MRIDIKSRNLDIDSTLVEYVEKKIGSVSRFTERFDKKEELIAFIELARTSKHHKKGNVFYAEVTLNLPGARIRVEHTATNIRLAINSVKDELQSRVKKYKEKSLKNH